MKNIVVPIFFIGIFMLISVTSVINKSDTTDEKFHLVRGIMLLETGDPRINQHHPYLFNVIPAIPTLFNKDLEIPSTKSQLWENADKDGLSFELVRINGGNTQFSKNVLFIPRVVMVLFASIMLYLSYIYTAKLFNWRTAMIFLILLSLSPSFIAHARLVTTDVPSALTTYLALLAFYDYFKNHKKKRLNVKWLIYLSVLSTVALMTKYSALFALTPVMILLMIHTYLNHRKNYDKKQALLSRVKEFLSLSIKSLKPALIVFAVIFTIMTMAYGFQFRPLLDMSYENERKVFANLDGFNKIRETSEWLGDSLEYIYTTIPMPFPQYINGFYENVFKHNMFGRRSFLLGEFSNDGWWYYFPVAYLLKESLTVLICLVLSLVLYVRSIFKDRAKLKFENLAFIMPVLFIIAISLNSTVNLGVRHLLTLFPIIYLFIGTTLAEINLSNLIDKIGIPKDLAKIANKVAMPFAILIFMIIPNVRIFPHYLTYFNMIVDHPGNGYKYLRDSNFDWYQNEIYVEDYIKERSDSSITYDLKKYSGYDQLVISKELLYGDPTRYSEIVADLNEKLSNNEIEIVDEIALTHVVLRLR